MKRKLDKIVAVGSFGLFGYYLGLSILKLPFLRILKQALPPISSSNLPAFYPSLLGIALAAPLGFLIYTMLIEKRQLVKYRKQYILGLTCMILLPVLVAGSLRLHAVSIVKHAESTIPTDVSLALRKYNLGFKINENDGINYRRAIRLSKETETLTEIRNAIRQLKLKNVVINNNPPASDVMYIHFDSKGSWYTRILSHEEGQLIEHIGYQKFAVYESPALEGIMQRFITQIKDISQYSQGSIVHSNLISANEHGGKPLAQNDLQTIVSLINNENKITPGSDTAEYFNQLLKEGVSKENQDVYGICLSNKTEAAVKLENFVIYSEKLGILWFEGEYYKADLSSIISKAY